ncbi:hypothetical protein [Granulicella paludicola]|uniref:hypothetical protein n=1 Tax=Granulicella paludicola TaxID=474951 RepID=UPI0021DF6EE8|nr:hypothetical protein [Granulicella paludicola]
MEITTEQQMETDFDWFCVDDEAQIAHFTTAGFKRLPNSVVESIGNQATLLNYFEQELVLSSEYKVDPELTREVSDPTECYLKSFARMACRGLYSFDIETYASERTNYFRVAIPIAPLSADELPKPIRQILEKTRWRGIPFNLLSRIPYKSTLAL